jgi:hypothetical protein
MVAPSKPRGFSASTLDALIAARQEPVWMTARRRVAWQTYA